MRASKYRTSSYQARYVDDHVDSVDDEELQFVVSICKACAEHAEREHHPGSDAPQPRKQLDREQDEKNVEKWGLQCCLPAVNFQWPDLNAMQTG